MCKRLLYVKIKIVQENVLLVNLYINIKWRSVRCS